METKMGSNNFKTLNAMFVVYPCSMTLVFKRVSHSNLYWLIERVQNTKYGNRLDECSGPKFKHNLQALQTGVHSFQAFWI